MRKTIGLSLIAAMVVQAAPVVLDEIEVEEKIDTEVIKNVSGEDIKSADVAEGLAKESASVWLVRRSGISNDVIVRGQKKTISM
jgi:iron complex outermembrane receptor protein